MSKKYMKLLVPISYFFNTPRSEIWSLDTASGNKKLLCTLDTSNRDVRGKGITGLAWLDEQRIVACDFNRMFKIDRESLSIVDTYEDDELNDLHSLSVDQDSIYLANSGRDSIDVFDHRFKLLERIDGLDNEEWKKRKVGDYEVDSSYFDSPDSGLPFHCRRVPDKWHLNHVFRVSGNLGGKIIATSFSTRSLLDAHTLEAVSSTLPIQPHDGIVDGDYLWVTTVSGQIYRSRLSIPFEFEMVIDLFKVAPYQGWCRGLLISGGFMFIGITSIYEKKKRTSWLNCEIGDTRSGIYQLSMETMDIVAFHDFSSTDGGRIFTMIVDR